MKISNVSIARIISDRGYDFDKALKALDDVRTPQDELKSIKTSVVNDLIENICSSFDIDNDEGVN